VLVALLSCVPVAFRHSRPVAATLVGSAVWLIPTDGYLYLGYVAALLLYYALAVEVDDARVVAAITVLGCALGALTVWLRHDILGELFGSVLVVVAPVAVGRIVRREREQQRRLEDLTLHLERERERGARAAVAEERARIARELHDVVAHSLSVIAVQADAAEAALARDPSRAGEPLRAIRGSAREALVDMRQLLHVLRSDDLADWDDDPSPDRSSRAPARGLADLPSLVNGLREAGLPLEADMRVDAASMPAGIELAVYRIVQEALTNVLKHAGAVPTRLTVEGRPDDVRVVVRNDRSRQARPGVDTDRRSGHGLIGVRERALAAGGTLHSGHTEDGGFELVATIPIDGERG
jgi:signal transduction histidine kinase